jgi:YD repeat-containing protein
MKLRARWAGAPPRVGDYLMSPTRPRGAYRITAIDATDRAVQWDQAQKQEVRRLTITADRVPTSAVHAHARVHAWSWDKRTRRKANSD